VDDHTGELLFFNYRTEHPYLHYGVVDARERLVHYVPIDLPGPRLPHDMAYTEHYAILNDLPLFWEPELIERGLYAARLHRELPSRLGVIPRRAQRAEGPDVPLPGPGHHADPAAPLADEPGHRGHP
jgi:carotenoid cleavage dioxygenase